jgi:hypothetical protein
MCRAPESDLAMPKDQAGFPHHHGSCAVQQGQSRKFACANWTNLATSGPSLMRNSPIVAQQI